MNENENRADWAAVALDAFTLRTYGGRHLVDLVPEDREAALADLLCDLRHLADRLGVDYELAEDRGRRHHADELAEDGPKVITTRDPRQFLALVAAGCTGYISALEAPAQVVHDGDTCPIHEGAEEGYAKFCADPEHGQDYRPAGGGGGGGGE